MILHDTAAVVIKHGNKFLLIKRRYKPEANYWGIAGGHVDKGETPYQAVKREAKEELGNIEIITKKPVYTFVHDVEIGHKHKAHIFLGKVIGKLKAASDVKEFGWFTLDQMKSMNITHYAKKPLNKLYHKQV